MVPVAVFVIVIVFVAAVAQATTGFGYALIAVPLLTLATDPRTAVVGAAISSMLLTVVLAVRERRFVRWFGERGFETPFRRPMIEHNPLHRFHFHLTIDGTEPALPFED